MIELLLMAMTLGAGAGLSPGPLLALLVSETMRSGFNAGCKVALVPLLTDLPIILLVYYGFTHLQNHSFLIAIISFCGGCYLLKMAIDAVFSKMNYQDSSSSNNQTLNKAIITNVLSPYPYLFWLTVGFPIILRAGGGISNTVIFTLGFYFTLVGVKLIIAWIFARSRQAIASPHLDHLHKILGIVLFFFAILLFKEAITLL